MENIKLEDIQTIFDTLNKSKLERKGYILLPDFEGFKLFEIDEDRLKLYLQAESLHKRALVDTNNELGTLSIPDVSTRTFRFADWVNGKHVDETFKAVNREDAIRIMNEKYPNHEFALAQELF